MKHAVELIVNNSNRHPEFRYYIRLMKKAERNSLNQPDICIETCKSLLEGISKSIIERLDSAADRKSLDRLDISPLVKKATQLLKQADNVIEDDFVTRCSSLAHALGTLRNERGDISHGKAVPKTVASDDRLSQLCMSMTESVICYMLDIFYQLSPVTPVAKIEVVPPENPLDDLPVILFEDNSDFNDWLDDIYPLPEGRVVYSSALYELYFEDYVIQLEAYRESTENEP